MSFLTMPNASINMAKATVSLWFRFPASTIDRINANPPPRGGASGYSEAATWPVLQWEMTLLSWGDQIQGTVDTTGYGQVGMDTTNPGHPVPIMGAVPGPSQTGPMAPCYIGLNCREFVRLVVNFQGSEVESAQNIIFFSYINKYFVGTPGVSGYNQTDITHPDATYILAHPMGVGHDYNDVFSEDIPEIKPEQWHHLLISWDMSGSLSCGGDSTAIDSSFKIYYALDDQNYDKNALPAKWIGDVGEPGSAGTDPNTVVSRFDRINSLPWPAGAGSSTIGFSEAATPAGSYSGTMGSLPGTKMYVPGSPDYTDGGRIVNSVYQVEMAELQIFTGVMLDTSKVSNRRAFVDKDGKPVDPVGTEDDPPPAEKLLGKKPAILLHGSSNWQEGYNTGTLGIKIETDGTITKLPNGQFKPVAGIEQYKPEPALEETTA